MTSRQLRILLVEDDEVDREMVHRFIGHDYCITDAMTGFQALLLFKSEEFDVVLLDSRLPDMDGLDMLEKFVAKGTPVVLITGSDDGSIFTAATNLGAFASLSKNNLSKEGLVGIINNSLSRRASAMALGTRRFFLSV